MMSIRETQKKYCSRALMVSIFIGFACFLLGEKALCRGLILGALFSVLNFILLGQSLPDRIKQTNSKRLLMSPGSIVLRYIIMAIPVFIAIKSESYDLIAAVGGLFAVQFMILLDHLTYYFINRKTTGIG